MRLASHVWVGLLLRRVQAAGGFGMILKRGEGTAGSVLIVERAQNGGESLYLPAPTAAVLDDPLVDRDHRIYERVLDAIAPELIRERLEKEAKFDPDHWVVELDGVDARDFLEMLPDDGTQNGR
ncbi:MAG: DUF1491 family protein [Pseudomonadota bacterium]